MCNCFSLWRYFLFIYARHVRWYSHTNWPCIEEKNKRQLPELSLLILSLFFTHYHITHRETHHHQSELCIARPFASSTIFDYLLILSLLFSNSLYYTGWLSPASQMCLSVAFGYMAPDQLMLIIFMRNLSRARWSSSFFFFFLLFIIFLLLFLLLLNGDFKEEGVFIHLRDPLARYGQVSRWLAHRCELIYPFASFNQLFR